VREWLRVDWATVKKIHRLGAHLVCLDETGFLMMPVLRRTWAPCGATSTLPVRTQPNVRRRAWRAHNDGRDGRHRGAEGTIPASCRR
jgi:hypothetical protein